MFTLALLGILGMLMGNSPGGLHWHESGDVRLPAWSSNSKLRCRHGTSDFDQDLVLGTSPPPHQAAWVRPIVTWTESPSPHRRDLPMAPWPNQSMIAALWQRIPLHCAS